MEPSPSSTATTSLGTGALSGGVATFTTSALPAGTRTLRAEYAGQAGFLASSETASQEVARDTTRVTLASSRNPARRGQPVVLTATVAPAHASASSGTGAITFSDGDRVLGTAEAVDGVAILTVRDLVKGEHPLTASYGGSADLLASEAALSQRVENTPPVAGAGTALELGSAAVTSATVASSGGLLALPAGTVELWARPGWTSAGEVGTLPSLFRLGSAAAPRLALGVSPDRKALVVQVGAESTTIPAALDDGGWHHLAVTTDGALLQVSVDGALAGAATDAPASSEGGLVLGEGFVGQLDEVRLWSVVRGAEALAAERMSPLAGDEAGLVALWRMDEGSGAELLDATANHLDGTLTIASGGTAFVPSLAWRARTGWQERDLAPIDAGYDADGDALTLRLVGDAPTLGTATVDPAKLQVNYHGGQKQLGSDRVSFALDDGEATSEYTVEVSLERILVCQSDASCGGGDLCVQGACVAPEALDARSGAGGCATGGGSAPTLWMLLAVALAWARGLRARLRLSRAARVAAVVVALASAPAAMAQVPAGFALQTFEPAPAGDRFFTVREAGVDGHLVPAASLTFSWAAEPLLLRRNGEPVVGGRIVHRQFWGFLGGSLALADRLLLDVSVPVALYQSGSQPFADLAQVSSSGFGDLRLGARVAAGGVGTVEARRRPGGVAPHRLPRRLHLRREGAPPAAPHRLA